jgi:hypothetical protein
MLLNAVQQVILTHSNNLRQAWQGKIRVQAATWIKRRHGHADRRVGVSAFAGQEIIDTG